MTLTDLRYLVNLDKERHFGRAAERSFVSQPTLSVAIKKLEEQLGLTLFERTPGEVRPTPVGEKITAQARRVLSEVQLIDDLAREGQDELAGPLRFGAIYTVAPYLLPYIVPRLRSGHPRMPLVIEENFTARLLEQLRDNEIDVILAALPIDQAGLCTWPVYDEDFSVMMPADHRWAKDREVSARNLSEERLLLLGPGHCFRDQVIEACPKCVEPEGPGLRPQTGSSLETIRHMVAGGLGVTVLPNSSFENRPLEDVPLVVARPFAGKAPSRCISLVWRKTYPRIKAINALRDAILDSPIKGVKLMPESLIQET